MTAGTHRELANFIWSICNLLRGPYKRNEYRKVILPLTVLRRFDCLLAPTKEKVLAEHARIKTKPETVVRSLLEKTTGYPFFNLSRMDLPKLLGDPNQLAPNLNAYINGFSKNVRQIMERFAFDQQIARMAEKNLLFEVVKKFATLDLSRGRVDNVQMGYVFEELIRIGAEQANEEESTSRHVLGDTFTKDGFDRDAEGRKYTFDYMLANPPFGVEWKQQKKFIDDEARLYGYEGRFGAGLPRINDGSLLFLQHMLSKMRSSEEGGSRIGIVFNGSPLFTGDADSGESNIRQKGKIQLIDARRFFVKMPKSLGNKRNKIGDPADRPSEPDQIADITRLFGNFTDGETRAFTEEDPITKQPVQRVRVVSKVFDNADFGFHKITVERPLRLNFQATQERLALLESESTFAKLATSEKKNETARLAEIEAGRERQEAIRRFLAGFAATHGETLYKDRKTFLTDLRESERAAGIRLSAAELKAIVNALGERDDTAEICLDRDGNPEPDADLRDTESVRSRRASPSTSNARSCPTFPTPGSMRARPSSATRSRSTATSTSMSRRGRWRSSKQRSRRSKARSWPCSKRSRREW